jgi:hypothetical protein
MGGGMVIWDMNHPDSQNYRLIKISSTGAIQWDKTYGGSGKDAIIDVKQTSDGGYVVIGVSNSPASGDKHDNAWNNSLDYWMLKLDQFGTATGDITLGGTEMDFAESVIINSKGNFIALGVSSSGVSGDRSETNWGGQDRWIVEVKDDHLAPPDPNPNTTIVCKTFAAGFDNTADPIRNEIVIMGQCATGSTVVKSGAKVVTRAKQNIVLQPGTIIEYGATFKAIIGEINNHPCDLAARRSFEPEVAFEPEAELKVESPILSVYPNPSSGIFRVEIVTKNQKGDVLVHNVFGREVHRIPKDINSSGNYLIDLQNQPAGIYLVSVSTDSGIISKRIVIK